MVDPVRASSTSNSNEMVEDSTQQLTTALTSIKVLAVSSIQVVLLVLIGSTGFLLSIVANILPTTFLPSRSSGRKSAGRSRRSSPSSSTSASTSISSRSTPRRQGSLQSTSSTISSVPSLPELLVDTGLRSDDSSSEHSLEIHATPYHHLAQAAVAEPFNANAKRNRRCSSSFNAGRRSLEIVRTTLHIPAPHSRLGPSSGRPTSPTGSRPCLTSAEGKLAHSRPAIVRLFSKKAPSPERIPNSESTSIIATKVARRNSWRIGSSSSSNTLVSHSAKDSNENGQTGDPSNSYAAVEVTHRDLPHIVTAGSDTSLSLPLLSPPKTSPSLKSSATAFFQNHCPHQKHQRERGHSDSLGVTSPPTSPRLVPRRTASDSSSGHSPLLRPSRHQIMAEARKERERLAPAAVH